MPTIKLSIDSETYSALIEEAARHLRPADWHASAILRTALGLPVPFLAPAASGDAQSKVDAR